MKKVSLSHSWSILIVSSLKWRKQISPTGFIFSCRKFWQLLRNPYVLLKTTLIHLSSTLPRLCQSKHTFTLIFAHFPSGIYLFKVSNRTTRAMCEICLKLIIKTPERRQSRRSGVVVVKFEQFSNIVLLFPMLTFNKEMPAGLFLAPQSRFYRNSL